ncbi:hypothetical protein Dda_6404 [Drechslerella dactyloides]|uniref:Uncharacterized protein n=1 Tax=Drechslerella dactyloides TaxID=74499 RepID=A0AAD6IUQ3_DREDA|nr:hypothetical protein Dda_6404 [Drechslerella dactyloides]
MLMSSSEYIRGVTGQWAKPSGSKLVESILHRSLSRELGQSLRADTIHTANSAFFPPTITVRSHPPQQHQRASLANLPRAQSVPIPSTRPPAESLPLPLVLPNIAETDPTDDDDAQLWERSRVGVQLTAEQAEFLTTPAEIPSLPFTRSSTDELERNIWANGLQNRSAGGSSGEVYEIEAENFEEYLQGKCWLYKRRIDEEEEEEEEPFDEFASIITLPEEFVELTVNEIFEVCYERCMARGKVEEEAARAQQAEKGDDAKSERSDPSSEACSEDAPFISSVNVVSIRKREVRRAREARAAMDAQLGIVREPVTAAAAEKSCSPVVETVDAGDISFASAGSDPERANEPPLFTIRSKKAPIKIVDPKTLQRPDKPKSPKDLAKDVAFLKRGLRIMEKGVELAREAYSMFKTVGMDNGVLTQTTEWMAALQEFVRNYTAILNKADSAKQAELRNTLFESEGQMMLQKKKMDNAILGWTNFAISMFPVHDFSPTAVKRPLPESANDENVDELEKESPVMKTKHLHNNVCANLTHELQKLTEDNRLKFKTLLSMLIESLGEAKVWLISAPSYAKVRPVKYTEIKSVETVPAMKVAPPDKGSEKPTVEKKAENEKPAEATAAAAPQTAYEKTNTDGGSHVEPQYYGHGWHQQHYGGRGYGQGREYEHNNSGHRSRSAVSQMPDAHANYNHNHQQGGYDNAKRVQNDGPRGRQMTRSSGHSQSRQQSAAANARQNYGHGGNNNNNCAAGPQPYGGYATHGVHVGEFSFNNDTGCYAEFRGLYGQPSHLHSHPHSHPHPQAHAHPQAHTHSHGHGHGQPVLQHPQPWRATTSGSDGHDGRANVSPEQSARGERGTQQQGQQNPQRSLTVTPQMLQHAMLQGPTGQQPPPTSQAHPVPPQQEVYPQVPVTMGGYPPQQQQMYSVYGHGWGHVPMAAQGHHHHHHHAAMPMHASQMQRKGVMYPPYGHHPFR